MERDHDYTLPRGGKKGVWLLRKRKKGPPGKKEKVVVCCSDPRQPRYFSSSGKEDADERRGALNAWGGVPPARGKEKAPAPREEKVRIPR